MVLFKDINEDTTNLLTKDFPHEKPYEFEYKNKNKSISFTNNAVYNVITRSVDTSTTIKYLNCNNITTEFKLNGGGFTSFDIKYAIPLTEKLKINRNLSNNIKDSNLGEYNRNNSLAGESCKYLRAFHSAFRGFTIGTKIEHKPKGKLSENNKIDLNLEYYDNKHIHTKFNVNPVTNASTLSTCLENKFNCGTFRIGAETTADDITDVTKANYSLGCSFIKESKNKIHLTGEERSGGCFNYLLFPSYIFTCKTAPYMDAKIGKIIVAAHAKTCINECPAELAIQAEHNLNDKYTNFLFGGQIYVNKSKDTLVKLKCSHDLENICLSLFHKFNDNMSANIGCRFDATKILDSNAFKYGAKINLST